MGQKGGKRGEISQNKAKYGKFLKKFQNSKFSTYVKIGQNGTKWGKNKAKQRKNWQNEVNFQKFINFKILKSWSKLSNGAKQANQLKQVKWCKNDAKWGKKDKLKKNWLC